MDLKLNLSSGTVGLDSMFKLYEEIMLRYMWNAEPTGSGKIWVHVLEELAKVEDKISRASVIFAANRFVEAKIWTYTTATGKGGHHRVYSAVMTEEQMWLKVRELATGKIDKYRARAQRE